MRALLHASLAASLLCACAPSRPSMRPTSPSPRAAEVEAPRWFHASGDTPRGVVLLLHGLNLKPSKMDFLAARLAGQGLDCYRPVLSGHEGDLEAFKHVTRTRWQDDVAGAQAEAARRARELGVPLHLVGFSLGGLLAIDVMENRPGVTFDRVVLFAPAVSPRPFARLTWFLSPFPSAVLPSAAPEEYRVHAGTPIAAYRSLMSSVNAVASRVDERTNRPTLVLFDPRDELLSPNGLARLLERKGLSRWRLVEVTNRDSTLEKSFHHLIIDDRAVGAAEWARIERLVRRHLEVDGPGDPAEAP